MTKTTTKMISSLKERFPDFFDEDIQSGDMMFSTKTQKQLEGFLCHFSNKIRKEQIEKDAGIASKTKSSFGSPEEVKLHKDIFNNIRNQNNSNVK